MIQTGELFFPDLLYILNYIEVNSKLKRRFPTEEFKRAIKQTIKEGYEIQRIKKPLTEKSNLLEKRFHIDIDKHNITIQLSNND